MYTSDSTLSIIRNAFSEFLLLPTIIIILFIGMAWVSYNVDHAKIPWLEPSRLFLRNHVFTNSQSTSGLLNAIVSGTLSITTLTTTLLLVIIQQSAGSMTSQVFDQFLRRTTNQFYLGFFVGLALYSMITLSTVNEPFNPVWGGTLAFSFTAVALYLLVLLMYTTINQMRPSEIINAIYERILIARTRQKKMLDHVCCRTAETGTQTGELTCDKGGFLNYIDVKKLLAMISRRGAPGQIVFKHSIGHYIPFGEVIATLHNTRQEDKEWMLNAIRACISLRVHRNLDFDAAFGIEQLENIAWTSGSSAQSNPSPAVLCVRNLHDIFNCWIGSTDKDGEQVGEQPVIYLHDEVQHKLFTCLQNIAVVTSESMQHQVFIAILEIFIGTLRKAPRAWQEEMEETILIMISVMGDHVYTTAMDRSTTALVEELKKQGLSDTARALSRAAGKLKDTVGRLNSRGTRV